MNRLIIPLFAAAALALSACAPKLSIRHEDPSYAFVQVRVDGETRGFVAYGTTMSMRLGSGYHMVEAIPRGEETNPWADDGEGWAFYIDRKAEITLLPDMSR
ncbi:MAG: hypothetical protein ACJAYU_003544 [Bradymonadia bacterium]|jgi:hypothetical protein